MSNLPIKNVKSSEYLRSPDNLHEYINGINLKCQKIMQNLKPSKKLKKVNDDEISIPTYSNYATLLEYDYNVKQLKQFAKHYKLKIGGNKDELILRVFSYLYLSNSIIKIQKITRGMFVKKYNALHGVALLKRNICVNECDFVTMDPVNEIKYHQFISYTDEENKVYGFDIVSLHNMLKKTDKGMKNPYNRKCFPLTLINNMQSIIRLGKVLKISINLALEDDKLSIEKALELRILSFFQKVDALGNYSDPKWFNDLNEIQIKKLIKELSDIWKYRAGIQPDIKRKICPPSGDPFSKLNYGILNIETNIHFLRKSAIEVFEGFINGLDLGNKQLGANLVLCALTLVSSDAAIALPWLYESVYY
jgi:hypothetical protein